MPVVLQVPFSGCCLCYGRYIGTGAKFPGCGGRRRRQPNHFRVIVRICGRGGGGRSGFEEVGGRNKGGLGGGAGRAPTKKSWTSPCGGGAERPGKVLGPGS